MARYQIIATVEVELNMEIEAGNAAEAEKLFNDGISMTAGMAGLDGSVKFDVWDDSISDVTGLSVNFASAD